MPYTTTNSKGQTYYLHSRVVTLKNDRQQRIYFFAKTVKDGVIEAMPAGFEITENTQTGLPVLRKIKQPV